MRPQHLLDTPDAPVFACISLAFIYLFLVECYSVCVYFKGRLPNLGTNLFTLFYTGGETYDGFNSNPDYEPAFFETEIAEEEAAAVNDTEVRAALDSARTRCNNNRQCLFDWLLTSKCACVRVFF